MRRARGAAAVELAVALVALVPALLFALLLHELARARAEAVEAASASAWDWAPLDFGAGAPPPEADFHVGERVGVGGRARWEPAVACAPPEREAGLFREPLFRALAREHARGGLVRCRALRTVEVTGAFRSVLPRGALALEPAEAALLVDPLAVDSGEGVRAGQRSGPLVARVAGAFRKSPAFALHAAATTAFFAEGVARDLLSPETLTLALHPGAALDDPRWPAVALVESPRRTRTPSVRVRQEGTARHYFSIPWRDWAGDAHARTGEARGPYFLGCRKPDGYPEDCE